jgi:hypothetical protein
MHIEKLFHPWSLTEEQESILKWRCVRLADCCLRNKRSRKSGGTKILLIIQIHFPYPVKQFLDFWSLEILYFDAFIPRYSLRWCNCKPSSKYVLFSTGMFQVITLVILFWRCSIRISIRTPSIVNEFLVVNKLLSFQTRTRNGIRPAPLNPF